MAETHTEEAQLETRRKRVRRLKKIIILTLIISILFPIILSIFLLMKTIRLEEQIEELRQIVALENTHGDMAYSGRIDEDVEVVRMETVKVEPQTQSEEKTTVAGSESTEGETIEEATETEQNTEEIKIRNVYLTFDDGPSVHTNEILDILKEYDVKATFFVVGKEGEKYEELYKRIVEEGHTLGMHSYSHRYDEI